MKRARSAPPNIVRLETPKEAPKEFYTVSQLADLLQLTEMTIYRMVNQGKLPCYCIGRIKRFRHEDIEEFLQACRVPAKRSRSGS